jgi:hypothetical protein
MTMATKKTTGKTTTKDVEKTTTKPEQKLVKTTANKAQPKLPDKKPEVKLVSQTIPVELTAKERLDRLEQHAKMGDKRDLAEAKLEAEKARHKSAKDILAGEVEDITGKQRDLRDILKANKEDRKLRVIETLDKKTRELVYLDPKTKKELHRRQAMAHELQKSLPGCEDTKPKPVKLEWQGITPENKNQLVSVGGAYQVRYETSFFGDGAKASKPGRWIARHGQETVADADGTIEWTAPGPAKAACQRHANAHPKPAAKAEKPNGKGKALSASIAERKADKAKQPRAGQSPLGGAR